MELHTLTLAARSYVLLTCIHMYTHAHVCRELVHCLAMTACDVCGTCKPWEVHRDGVEDLFNEFYHQVWLDVWLAVWVYIVCMVTITKYSILYYS